MLSIILKNSIIGFVFGIIIAVIAFFGNFPVPGTVIPLIPFIFGLLSALGSLGAMFVIMYISAKFLIKEKLLNIMGFITATLINTLIAVILVYSFPDAFMHRELIILYFIGIGMGAVYGIYRYRVDTLNERMQFLEELADKNRRLQETFRELAITRERNRMGRELHDSVSQGLHGLIFAIHSLRNSLSGPDQKVTDILNHMEDTANSTLAELRAMIEELKPTMLTEKGLEKTLEATVNLFSQQHGIPAKLHVQLPEEIKPELEMAIYRISQEALANIAKHAGATQVVVEISCNDNDIILNIKDDGKGFNVKALSKGHGLKNMRQRAEDANGSLQIISKSSLGTSIIANLPRAAD